MESEDLSESRSGVAISITNASASEDELESEQTRKSASNKWTADSAENDFEKEIDKEVGIDGTDGSDGKTHESLEDQEIADAFNNGVSISDEKPAEEQNGGQEAAEGESKDSDHIDEKPQIEVVGDRVLIERDGKFELVDASEIKAEYFEMLGISMEQKGEKSDDDTSASPQKEAVPDEKPAKKEQTRPQTSALGDLQRRTRKAKSPERRTMSAKTRRSDDYAHLKSQYGLSEEQMKIKRRREEAIAKRKKEEKEREEEEDRRKREDAERAFQAWLSAKIEDAKEKKREEALRREDPTLREQREKESLDAYDQWLVTKRQQDKLARDYERSRRSEEAQQFIIRDRQLCDEAFKRWMRKKHSKKREQEALKKKKKKSKPRLKKKEPLPINSKNITYYEYYGYRNNVVL